MSISPSLEIRDPLHGAIAIDAQEKAVIDHPFVQRLRGIRQLGFSHIPFPGATHSRFSHSLGVMELAGRAFDVIFRDEPFSSKGRKNQLRHCVRLAALCHDLGHGPYSHAAEFAMPDAVELNIEGYGPDVLKRRKNSRATHEDYTVGILTGTSLSKTIEDNFEFEATHVAALVNPEVTTSGDFFCDRGHDLKRVLSQLISSNLDCDRLDYLGRDSFFTGTQYGQVDVPWLISHMGRHVDEDNHVGLAIDRAALYAFDDFMVARFHMFMMVYFHQKSVAYELLLRRTLTDPGCDYELPADVDLYLNYDDAHMLDWLRRSSSPWAKRILEGRLQKPVLELHGEPGEIDLTGRQQALNEAGIDAMCDRAIGVVYQPPADGKFPIIVTDARRGMPPMPLHQIRGSIRHDRHRIAIARIFVDAADVDAARGVIQSMGTPSTQQRFL